MFVLFISINQIKINQTCKNTSPIKTVQSNVGRLYLRVEGVLDQVGVLLHDVHVMVVVFVFFLLLVVEHDVPLRLLNVRLEHFVRRVGQFAPFVQLVFEQVVADVRVAV